MSKKVLVCGAGKIARELFKRMGDSWDLTVIEKSEERFNQVKARHPHFSRFVLGDASSPVVLAEADLANQDYVLAMTDNDSVNLAIVEFARGKGVNHVLARVHDPDQNTAFSQLGVRTLLVNTMLAKNIFHYLEDPRVGVTPLADGRGEVLEIDVTPHMWLAGRTSYSLNEGDWRLAAIFRDGEMLFPGPLTLIQAGDRLVIVGRPDSFAPVCRMIECGQPHFPLAYGGSLLLALPPKKEVNRFRLMAESIFLAQNTRVRAMTVLCTQDNCDLQEDLDKINQGLDVRIEPTEEDIWDAMYDLLGEESIGLVVVPPFETSFLKSLGKPPLITLAHSLPCPLFVARNSEPYDRILVPFNATARAELALETAADLARQMGGSVTAAVVEAPEFMHDTPEEDWLERVLNKIRELGHIHKIKIGEAVRKGNPVKEIVDLAQDFDLMVIGSTSKESGLFSPHVGDLLARRAPCSVLILTG